MNSPSPGGSPFPTRMRLEERLRELNQEIRAYPQPIAHCDAQLAGLLAERAELRSRIDQLAARTSFGN